MTDRSKQPDNTDQTIDVPTSAPDSLEAELAAAFAKETTALAGSASVLAAMQKKLPQAPRVLLRDTTDAGSKVVLPGSPQSPPDDDTTGKYQIFGEIARGGMGAVLRGRDRDLGRELALKVLLESHRDRPEMLQRFIEEAQIGGQLQHPGIAPVYELGQFKDQRPYFTMKLVKGRTLAALLDEVREQRAADRGAKAAADVQPLPLAELPRFLGIFDQVCQTMAYAHARGVIHRDLKPSNIMVGAFGEVQVMDWGMAKVLADGGVADERRSQHPPLSEIQTFRSEGSGSETQAGAVMGTPAYMPPEQARGDVPLIDERADVFGLGAILCEILTGRPPYTGKSGAEIHRKALNSALEESMARLDACGADEELISLAKQSLASEPRNRPRNAGVVARQIKDYLSGVQDRLERAQLERAAAEARAEQAKATVVAERRARKLLISLALVMLVASVVSVSAAAFAFQQKQVAEGQRQEAEDQRKEAEKQRGEAQAAREKAEANEKRAKENEERAKQLWHGLDYAVKREVIGAEGILGKIVFEIQTELEHVAGAEQVRRRLLEQILDAFDHFARDDLNWYTSIVGGQHFEVHQELGYLYLELSVENGGGVDRAIEQFQKSYDIAMARDPEASWNSASYTYKLRSIALRSLADAYRRKEDRDKALDCLKQSYEIRKKLAADYPKNLDFQFGLADIANGLGNVLREEDPQAALERYEESVEILEKAHDGVEKRRLALAAYADKLTLLHYELGNYRASLAYSEKELATLTGVAAGKEPTNPLHAEVFRRRAESLFNCERLCMDGLADFDRAGGYITKLAELTELFAKTYPKDVDFQKRHVVAFFEQGTLAAHRHDYDKAQQLFERGLALLRQVKADGADPAWTNLDGRIESFETEIARAEQSRRAIADPDFATAQPRSPEGRRELLLFARGMALAAQGKHAEAAKTGEKLAECGKDAPAEYFQAARVYSRCAEAVTRGKQAAGVGDEEKRLVDGYARRAIELLRQAQDAGYFQDPQHAGYITSDNLDLAALKSHEAYQKLVTELSAPTEPR